MSESSPGPRLVHVTFTGADHTVDAGALAELLGAHRPGTIELAVLGSVSKQGAERYPVPSLALDIVGLAKRFRQRSALHLCGKMARHLVDRGVDAAFDGAGAPWLDVVWAVDRVQVNLPEPDINAEEAQSAIAGLGKPVIFQLRAPAGAPPGPHTPPGAFEEVVFPPLPAGATWLFDPSGGRGRRLTMLPALPGDRLVGYAGGITPDNVANIVNEIGLTNPDARIGFWIDLETGARARMNPGVSLNDDPPGPTCFSTSRCAAVMAAVAPFLSA